MEFFFLIKERTIGCPHTLIQLASKTTEIQKLHRNQEKPLPFQLPLHRPLVAEINIDLTVQD